MATGIYLQSCRRGCKTTLLWLHSSQRGLKETCLCLQSQPSFFAACLFLFSSSTTGLKPGVLITASKVVQPGSSITSLPKDPYLIAVLLKDNLPAALMIIKGQQHGHPVNYQAARGQPMVVRWNSRSSRNVHPAVRLTSRGLSSKTLALLPWPSSIHSWKSASFLLCFFLLLVILHLPLKGRVQS